MTQPGGARIDLAGRGFAYRVPPPGPDLILINGYGGTGADWDPTFLAELGARFTVLCPDNRGLGDSDLGDPADCTMAAMAADIAALIEALGLARVPVVGWSMGGFIAQQLAASRPDLVWPLILLGTDAGGPDAVPTAPAVWERMTDQSGTPRERAARLIFTLFPPDAAAEIDRRFGDTVAAASGNLSPTALAAQQAAVAQWHGQPPAPLPQSTPPVLAICGSEDIVMPPANQELLARRWPDCRTATVDGAGHAFMAQQPLAVARLIIDFVVGVAG